MFKPPGPDDMSSVPSFRNWMIEQQASFYNFNRFLDSQRQKKQHIINITEGEVLACSFDWFPSDEELARETGLVIPDMDRIQEQWKEFFWPVLEKAIPHFIELGYTFFYAARASVYDHQWRAKEPPYYREFVRTMMAPGNLLYAET